MKVNNKNRSGRLFILLLAGTFSFILVSIILVYKITIARSYVENRVAGLRIATSIDMNVFSLYSSMDNMDEAELRTRLASLAGTPIPVASNPELANISSLLGKLNTTVIQNQSPVNKPEVRASLVTMKETLWEIIAKRREELSATYLQLSDYWKYTYVLVAIACALSVLLSISGLLIGRARNQLIEVKRNNRLLLNNSIDCIIVCDTEGKIQEFNKEAERLFGYRYSEVKNKDVRMLYSRESDYVNLDRHLTEKKGFTGEVLNRHKNGEAFTSFLSANLLYDANRKLKGSMGISRDITQQKKQENEFRHIVSHATDIIYTADKDGNFVYVNPSVQGVLGYTSEELAGKPYQYLVDEADLVPVQQYYIDHFKNKRQESYFEFRVIRKDGVSIWVGQNIKTVFSPLNAGLITGFHGIVRNINDRKTVEFQLMKSEVDFRQIAETISDVFYLYNISEKKYEYISPNCREILGADQEFFYSGKSHTSNYVHPEDKPKLLEANTRVGSGKPYEIEYRLIVGDKTRWINEKSFPIRDANGVVTRNSGICRDVTNIYAARETIHNQNLEIGKSIVYAKTIQDSSLPTSLEIANLFEEFFVFYSPKDILSGDFYVFESLKMTNREPVTAFMVGDCTGHGVPGGILSLLCTSLIKESFSVIDPRFPSETLDFVRQKIVKFFRSNHLKHTQDGMDIAFCVLNKKENKLYFSGANAFIIIIRNNELIQYNGDKQHVGYSMKQRPFSNHEIEVEKGDCIYLFTDGYADQFGGPLDKRYSRKRLKNLLLSVHLEPMESQYHILKNEFYDWKGAGEQTDDVAMIGVRI